MFLAVAAAAATETKKSLFAKPLLFSFFLSFHDNMNFLKSKTSNVKKKQGDFSESETSGIWMYGGWFCVDICVYVSCMYVYIYIYMCVWWWWWGYYGWLVVCMWEYEYECMKCTKCIYFTSLCSGRKMKVHSPDSLELLYKTQHQKQDQTSTKERA